MEYELKMQLDRIEKILVAIGVKNEIFEEEKKELPSFEEEKKEVSDNEGRFQAKVKGE